MRCADMKYRSLGHCGTKVSMLSLGGWITYGDAVTDEPTVKTILTEAFEGGINFFDMADQYAKGKTEECMGKLLKAFPRHELVLSSKVFFPMSDDVNDRGLSRKHIMESVEKSLKRIGTDYLDLYFCHRYDEETPLEETIRAMDDLIHQGKILYWGTSDWTGDQIRDAHEICDELNCYHPQVEQPRYNLLARKQFEQDVRPALLETGMGAVNFSPLAYGILTGKYDDGTLPSGSRLEYHEWLRKRYFKEEIFAIVKKMKSIADRLGCTRSQLALAWCAAQEGISSVITGATKVEQLRDNLGAKHVELSEEIRSELDSLFDPQRE
ncbi:aldo/keto reductase [bacterium]|nr:aldo/keto reductase [bacterium]